MAGTRDDAILIVQIAQWGATAGFPAAASQVYADDFDPATAEISDPAVRLLLGYNETIATLVKNDLLDRELVYDWLWVAGTWELVGPAATRARERASFPQLYANFEELASGQR